MVRPLPLRACPWPFVDLPSLVPSPPTHTFTLFSHMQPQPLSTYVLYMPRRCQLAPQNRHWHPTSAPFLHPPARHPPACLRSSETSGESPCGQSRWSSPHDLNDIPRLRGRSTVVNPYRTAAPFPLPPCHLSPAIVHATRVPSFHGAIADETVPRQYLDSSHDSRVAHRRFATSIWPLHARHD